MSGKSGGRHFGAHTLCLTKLFPVTYSALTFKKKILTCRIHTSYSHTVFTRLINTPYTHANPFIGRIREEFEQIERIREETERHTHTPYSHAVHTCRTHTPTSSLNYPFTGLRYCLYNPFIGQNR